MLARPAPFVRAVCSRSASASGASRAFGKSAGAGGGPQRAKLAAKRGPITFLSLALVSVGLSGVLVYYQGEKERKTKQVMSKVTTIGKAALGGPWILVDQDGIPRTDASYKGKYVILYFGFTFCPDICPSELVKIGKTIDVLEEKGIDVTPLFISVDPPRDTLEQMKNYAQDFHPKIQYLTGTKDQVEKASKAYRVYFSKANENENDEEDYLVDHSIVFYLLDKTGEFRDFFTQRSQVGDIVDKVLSNMKADKEA